MEPNGKQVTAEKFAFDGCHKIYLLDTEVQEAEAENVGYQILPIAKLEETYNDSCSLKFISDWALEKHYVNQFEEAVWT